MTNLQPVLLPAPGFQPYPAQTTLGAFTRTPYWAEGLDFRSFFTENQGLLWKPQMSCFCIPEVKFPEFSLMSHFKALSEQPCYACSGLRLCELGTITMANPGA